MAGDGPSAPARRERRGLIGPFTGRQLIVAAAAVLGVGALAATVTAPMGGTPAAALPDPRASQYAIASPGEGLRVGDRPPDLLIAGADGTPVPITDLDGRPVRLAELRGRPVWINFWASWCPPCQGETPTLRDLAERYRDAGLTVVGISVQESTVDDVRAYARRYGLRYRIAADLTGELFRRYRIYGLPTQLFLDRDGVIRAIVQGPVDRGSAVALIESLLADPAAGASDRPAASPTP